MIWILYWQILNEIKPRYDSRVKLYFSHEPARLYPINCAIDLHPIAQKLFTPYVLGTRLLSSEKNSTRAASNAKVKNVYVFKVSKLMIRDKVSANFVRF
jgi:hypothetical protein